MAPAQARRNLVGIGAAALLCGLLVAVFAIAPRAGATGAGALEAKFVAARGEASTIAADLRESHTRLAAAQDEAAAAAAREEQLSSLLAGGQERAAELSRKLALTRRRLAVEKARLRRSRHALAARLVAIYESGTPSTASLVLGSSDYQELITRADYLRAIEESDSALAHRVEQVRNAVRYEARLVAVLEARAVAYDERLAAARSQIASVREAAEAAAAHLQSISASRETSLASLKSNIGIWVKEIQAARAAEALAASPLLDSRLHRDVRVGWRLQRRQSLEWGRGRLPDPPLDLGTLRRPGRSSRRAQGGTRPHRRCNLGRFRPQRLGLRLTSSVAWPSSAHTCGGYARRSALNWFSCPARWSYCSAATGGCC